MLCLKIHTISSMFFVFFLLAINYVESDNMYVICKRWRNKKKRWLQYTQSYPSKIRENNRLATLNHNQRQNSNLIMPFLVQNDNDKTIKGLTTLWLQIKKKSFFFLEMRSISLKCIKLYLFDYKTKSKANLLQTGVWECARWGIFKAKLMIVPENKLY